MRFLLLYTLLVGVPVLGVLWLGSPLRAPPAVGGSWTVTRVGALCSTDGGDPTQRRGCPAPFGPGTTITVTQSGPHVEVRFGDLLRTSGRVRRVTTDREAYAVFATPPGQEAARLNLQLRRLDRDVAAEGMLQLRSDCPVVHFSARPVPPRSPFATRR